MDRLKYLFSFSGRIDRKGFRKLGLGSLIGLVVLAATAEILGIQGPIASLIAGAFLIIIAGAFLIIFVSACTRRARDQGSSGAGLFFSVAFNVLAYPISWIWLSFGKAWDENRGLDHILAILKHISRQGGYAYSATAGEKEIFQALAKNALGLPDNMYKLAESEFLSGNPPTKNAICHAKELKAEPELNSEMLSQMSLMFMGMAAANGQPSAEKLKLMDQINEALDVVTPLPPGIADVISLAAKIAKADGRVSREELDKVDEFLRYGVGLSDGMRREAIKVFQSAKDNNKSYQSYADNCAEGLADELAKELTFRLFLEIALADGDLHKREIEILEYIARAFDIEHEFGGGDYGFEADADQGSQQEKEDAPKRDVPRDAEYHAKVLGVDPNADYATIKKAWKEKMKQTSPDQVQHMSEEVKIYVNELAKKINIAHDYFKDRMNA